MTIMKRIFTLFALFLLMALGCRNSFAQEVTITLRPGWNWIGYALPEEDSLTKALGAFVPVNGDIIKSQTAHSTYNDGHWYGSFETFTPGLGYMYLSHRDTAVAFSFVGTIVDLELTTSPATDVTAISATCGGSAHSDSEMIYLRGVCWGTDIVPSFTDNHKSLGPGDGIFNVPLTNLLPNTTYFYRAFVVTRRGPFFGETLSFTTENGVPSLTTASVTEIESYSATCGGTITDNGGAEVTDRGVCWSTAQNPTVLDSHISSGTGLGTYEVTMTELSPLTTYYVRAFAITAAGVFYGNEVSFTTLNDGTVCPTGGVDALFSVSPTQQVYFSQGNLQYIGSASTPYWKFADHQWDCLGDGTQASDAPNVDRDLFCWGTSGYDHGAVCYQPWCTSTDKLSYFAYGIDTCDLFDYTGQADWGYNAIVNGGNTENTWRCLTREEWVYVLLSRPTPSGIRFAMATVAETKGVIILPDAWTASIYSLSNTNQINVPFNCNIISAADWDILEESGAIFLPAAGYRNGTSVSQVGDIGYYWTSSHYLELVHRAYAVILSEEGLTGDHFNRYSGRSVRLVYPIH